MASDKTKLERIQRGLRANDGQATYEKLLNNAKLITLCERRLQDIACLMHKVKHGTCPQSVRDLFSVNSTGYDFRGADFHIPRFHFVTYGKHSLRYPGPKLWNSLSSNLRNLPSLQSFKRQIRLVSLLLKLKSDCETCVLCSN